MALSASVLWLENLQVRRGSAVLLDHVSWRVERGQHWALLGANGSGKTSLLRALTGYLTPSGGSIEVLGQRYGASDWRELRKHIGLVSSALQAAIPEDESAAHTVVSGVGARLGLIDTPTARETRQAVRLLHALGVGALADRPWGQLSQGERQRVLIARARLARPQVLILDEPCAGLDPVAREDFLQQLAVLATRRHGPALLLVTHHVEEILPCFSHVLLLRAGRVVAAGPRAEVLTDAHLTTTFGAPIRLRHRAGRLQLSLKPQKG